MIECPVLVSNKKYNGKYVALQSFNDRTVVAWGKDPARVIASAKRKGVEAPVIVLYRKKIKPACTEHAHSPIPVDSDLALAERERRAEG